MSSMSHQLPGSNKIRMKRIREYEQKKFLIMNMFLPIYLLGFLNDFLSESRRNSMLFTRQDQQTTFQFISDIQISFINLWLVGSNGWGMYIITWDFVVPHL